MRSAILGGLAAALLLASAAPALADAPVKPLTPAQLRAALLTPEDLGDDFTSNPKHIREALDSTSARTERCVKVIKALKPLLISKAAAFVDKEGKPSGVKQFVLSGTPAKMAPWQNVGKVMVRDCAGVKASGGGVKKTITKLSIGKFGDWTYGIRYKETGPETYLQPVHARDVVLIGGKNTVMLLVSDGFFGTFDPGLSKKAARVAVPKLRDASKTVSE